MSPEPSEPPQERRILAVVLPELCCEAARRRSHDVRPDRESLAVVFDPQPIEGRTVTGRDSLSAVSPKAYAEGVRPGRSVTQACAEHPSLRVELVTRSDLERLLCTIVEVVGAFGVSAGFSREMSPPDTVWLDVTGCARLFGGEHHLAQEVLEQVRLLGHTARVVVASGPTVARALGLYGIFPKLPLLLVPANETRTALRDLPLLSVPELADRAAWFSQLGILTLGQLEELPPAALAGRLGPAAGRILRLLDGDDPRPLEALALPVVLEESQRWEEGSSESSVLLFALRGLFGRLSARLRARGEAALQLDVRLEMAESRGRGPEELHFDAPAPIWRESELLRLVRPRLERLTLEAPVLGVTVRGSALVARVERQLDISKGENGKRNYDEELPFLLSELLAEIGQERVGYLTRLDHHRPELRSRLLGFLELRGKKREKTPGLHHREQDRVTRLIEPAVEIPVPFEPGARFVWEKRLYVMESLRFSERLEAVEWWSAQSTSRDYLWAWLSTETAHVRSTPREHATPSRIEALVYVDRRTGRRFLQGFCD